MNRIIKYYLTLPFLFFLLASGFFFPSQIGYAYPDGWSDDILINQTTADGQRYPDVSTDNQNNVWICWDDATWTEGEVYFSKRDSLGNCLIPETTVSNNLAASVHGRVRVDASNNVHFVWRDQSPQGYGIAYAKLSNNGSVIVPPHLVLNGAGGMLGSVRPEIALNKNKEVNIIWDEYPSGYNQMNYTKLDGLGDTLIAKMQITPIGINTYWPGIGVDSLLNCHLAYRSDSGVSRLCYTKLDKDGNILVNNKTLTTGGLPTLISDKSQNIHVIYSDATGSGNRIEYLKLDNNGNILIGPMTISLPQINSNTYAHMAIDSLQYLHVVWQADSCVDVHIMYAELDTNGNFVIPPMKIVYPYQSGEPRIAVDHNNRLHVVWIDGRLNSGGDIFYKRGENEMTVKEIGQLKAVNFPELSVFPNPFGKETRIVFSFSRMVPSAAREEKEKTQIEVYDILGRNVKEFNIEGSNGSICWQGDDDNGNHLPAGVYFVRLRLSRDTWTVPVVLLHY